MRFPSFAPPGGRRGKIAHEGRPRRRASATSRRSPRTRLPHRRAAALRLRRGAQHRRRACTAAAAMGNLGRVEIEDVPCHGFAAVDASSRCRRSRRSGSCPSSTRTRTPAEPEAARRPGRGRRPGRPRWPLPPWARAPPALTPRPVLPPSRPSADSPPRCASIFAALFLSSASIVGRGGGLGAATCRPSTRSPSAPSVISMATPDSSHEERDPRVPAHDPRRRDVQPARDHRERPRPRVWAQGGIFARSQRCARTST